MSEEKKTVTVNPEHLIALQYAPNPCCTQVVGAIPDEIEVDLEHGVWRYKKKRVTLGAYAKHEWRIGEMRHCDRGSRGGVIGVYDRMNDRHLNQMAHHACEATSEPPDYGESGY